MLDLSKIGNLAITGANGFVGRSIVEKISELSDEFLPKSLTLITRTGLDYKIDEKIASRVTEHSQDLREPWTFTDKVSHMINLAADGSRGAYSEEACMQFTLISKNLVRWLSESNWETNLFHASSGACFGYKPLGGIDDLNPKKLFTQNRIEVEDFLAESSSAIGFSLSIGRLFTFSGLNILKKPQYALSDFILSGVNQRRIHVKGNPRTQRSYLHQAAMSEWILKAVLTTATNPSLQIGSSDAVTIEELATCIALETGSRIEYSQVPTNGDIYVPENSETRIKLGVSEGLGWKEAVTEMISKARILNHGAN